MKTNKLLTVILLSISMMLSACMDIEVTTILNTDGSLERFIEVRSDSELKDYSALPFPVDSSWQVAYKLDTINSKKPHIYSLKKTYKNASEINMAYKNIPNSLSKFQRELKVEKKFRWFFTYFTYSENCKKMARGNYKPFGTYLSDIEKEVRKIENPDTLAQILQLDSLGADNFKKGIDKKFEKWMDDNLTEEVLLFIERDMQNSGVKNIKISDLRTQSDSIYKFIDSIGIDKGFDKFYTALNTLFNTNEFDKIINSKKSELSIIEEEVGYIIELSGFKYKLKMPGLLIDTNAESVKGNQLDWEFVPFEAYFVGTSQFAESRIVNVWAFVLSGVFLLVVLIVLFVPALKRSKQAE